MKDSSAWCSTTLDRARPFCVFCLQKRAEYCPLVGVCENPRLSRRIGRAPYSRGFFFFRLCKYFRAPWPSGCGQFWSHLKAPPMSQNFLASEGQRCIEHYRISSYILYEPNIMHQKSKTELQTHLSEIPRTIGSKLTFDSYLEGLEENMVWKNIHGNDSGVLAVT